MVRWRWRFLFKPDAPYFHMLSPGSQKSCCLSYQATPLNAYWLRSERVGVFTSVWLPTCQCLSKRLLEWHIHKPLPTPCSLLHTSNPSFCYGRGCTLAFPKQPQHATLPDSTSLPSQDTDRLNWAERRLDWTVWHTHQQDKVDETAEHMPQGKLSSNIHIISLESGEVCWTGWLI